MDTTRRTFLRATALGATALGLGGVGVPAALADPESGGPESNPWARANYISAKVRRLHFPDRWFDVTEFGAVGDGGTDCTAAFRDAIAACNAAGGGHVRVPSGVWATGAIHLLSNVDLHVTEGARIAFSTDPSAYLPTVLTRFEGTEAYNYSPLIYAYRQHNIAVTGGGVLDGQASDANWWAWKSTSNADKDRLIAMGDAGVPVEQRQFGGGYRLRPSFIEPHTCTDVEISGITIVNSPMWEVHPTLSQNVLVEGITVNSHGPNNDGCDPECSRMVVIRDCTFDTGDDCIAIKSGKNADGRRVGVPSLDILVEDCRMADGHGGVTIGSEMSGGARNVFVRNCEMSSPNLNIALRFKTNSARGGYITNFHAKDITVGEVSGAAIDVNFYYGEGDGYDFNPKVSGINVENMTVRSAKQSLNVSGYPDDHIVGLHLRNVDFGTTTKAPTVAYVDDVTLVDVTENGRPLQLS
ncbi:glycoside hydrolase family 28 protein [Phycicoccus sp. M110.8]|uniref:glycoside hydrolase family 28 protein n=1 Tax=Phycicoccus sp. M110.8 TaxID=3075433 RepID=UPI0028FDB936|nr:glycoside hydrolase family 28 protein [Phycicoccus sp. M110.8]MDU0315021.1 glycoside hydrolase family 28 protein [Phycicoccus sp. M110.8]